MSPLTALAWLGIAALALVLACVATAGVVATITETRKTLRKDHR